MWLLWLHEADNLLDYAGKGYKIPLRKNTINTVGAEHITKIGRSLPEKSENGIISELKDLQVTRVIFILSNYDAILKIIACQNYPRRSTGYENQFSLILVYSIWFNQVRILSIIYLRLNICFVSVAAINNTYDDKKDCHNNSSEYIA